MSVEDVYNKTSKGHMKKLHLLSFLQSSFIRKSIKSCFVVFASIEYLNVFQ